MIQRAFALVFSVLMVTSIVVPFVFVGVVAASDECDFVVGDGGSIQDAIDDAAPGDTICVETGTYSEQLTVNVNVADVSLDGLTLVAAGGHSPVLGGSGSGTGIHIDGATDVSVEGFEIREYDTAIRVEDSPDATIESNTMVDNNRGIRDDNTASHGMVVANNTIENSGFQALFLQGSDNIWITGNHIEGGGQSSSTSAIYVRGGSGGAAVLIEGNTIVDNRDTGVFIWTPDAVVRDNTISGHSSYGINFRTGLGSQNAHDAVIENNILDNDGTNVRARSVRNTELRGNTLSGPGTDIEFEFVRHAVIVDNDLTTGLFLDGSALEHFDYDVSGNTINGDPFVYVNGEESPTIPATAGQIVVVDSTNVDVSGFEFDALAAGIQVAYSSGVVVSDNTVTNSTSTGIQLWDSDGATIENNVVTENGIGAEWSVPAIGVAGSSNTAVRNNEVADNDGRMLLVEGSTNTQILDNEFRDNAWGLSVFGSDDSELRNNTITGTHHDDSTSNFASSVLVSNSERVTFEANHIFDNAGNGIHDNRGQNSRDAVMTENVITGNGNDGIYWGNSRDATITNNIVSSNGGTGIYGPYGASITENTVENNAGGFNAGGIRASHNALIENNIIHANGNNGVHAGNASVIRNNTITDSSGAGILLRYFGYQTIENNDVSGHQADLVIFETESVTVRDNTFETGVQLISSSNPYSTLVEDLTMHSFSGNTVAGKELFYVYGEDNPSIPDAPGQVIVVNSTGVTVSDLAFEGVTAPIQIVFSDATVANNIVTDSTGSTVPRGTITLWGSDDSLVADNVVTGSADDGLRVVESERVELARNTISNVDQNGIRLEGATNTGITDDTISNAGSGGLYAERSAGLLVDGITVENSGGDGLYVDRSDGATIAQTSITGSDGRGIYLRSSDGASIEDNTVAVNAESGIESGFGWTSSDNATIATNFVAENGDVGIDFGGSGIEGIEITTNTVSSNQIGIRGSNSAVVTDNVVTDNVVTGILVVFQPNDIAINFNEIENNSVGLDYDRATWGGYEPVNATYNWWGAATGPSGGVTDPETGTTADGDGDSVDENVRFDPWLTTDPADSSPEEPDTAFFEISSVSTNSPVNAGEDLIVDVTVTNTGDAEGTQTVELEDFDGIVVDSMTVTLPGSGDEQFTLTWETQMSDAGSGAVTVRSEYDSVTEQVSITSDDPIAVDECTIIDTPGTYFLDGDLTGSTTCIQITSSDVTFDGVGHTIQGQNVEDTGQQFGILVYNGNERLENVVVRNVTVKGWDFGVRLRDTDNSEVTDVTAENGSSGVSLLNANSNELSDIETRNNSFRSIILSSSGQNMLTDIESTNDQVDASYSSRGSIYVFSSNQNEFENVDVSGGFTGIRVLFSLGNSFIGVTTVDNTIYGVEVESNSNTFRDVIATGNGWHGIQIQTASNNQFENVSVSHTDGSAIRLTSIGGSGSAPSGNVFENVTVTDNDGSAVSLSGSSSNQFRNLTLASNAGAAVNFVSNSQANLVEGGEIDQGSYRAFSFGSNSVGNTVRDVALLGTGSAFVAQDGDPNNVAERLDINGTVVSFAALGATISSADPTTLPDGATLIDKYVSISPAAPTTHVEYVRFHYDAMDVQDIDESALGVWHLSDEWQSPNEGTYDSSINTTGQYVLAENVTETGTYGVFAEGPQPALAVTNTSLSSTQFEEGDTVTVTAEVENVGEVAGGLVVALEIDGTVVDSETVTLDVNETTEMTFTHTFGAEGMYEVTVNGVSAGTVTVTEELVADIAVFGGSIKPKSVDANETVTVTGDLYNGGSIVGDETIQLTVDGEVITETTVTVAPGIDRKAVSFEWTPGVDLLDGQTSVEVEIRLNGFVVGNVTVENRYSEIQVIAATTSDVELIEGETTNVIGSVYQAGNIVGTETIEFTATNQDTSNTEVVGSQELTVAPGTYLLGAINISFTPDEPGTYDLELGGRNAGTVEVEAAESDIQVMAASTSRIELIEGETTHTIGSVYQGGNIVGTETIELTATQQETGDTEVVGSQEVTVAPGTYLLGAINISFTPNEPGTYDLTLGDTNAGTVEVEAAESDIQVIAASASEVEIIEGETPHVIGSVYQAGNIVGTETIELTAIHNATGDTEVVGSQELTVAPGTYLLGAINISFTPDEPGTYDLELGGRNAGTVEVEAAESDIQVIAATTSDVELIEGETTHTIGSVYQAGNIVGTETIELTATHNATGETTVVGSQAVTVAPGTYLLGVINISFTPDDPGHYDLELGGRNAGTVEVEETTSDIQVIAASASEVEIIQGEEIYVIGSVYQAGDITGTEEITLTATHNVTGDTEVVGSQEVTVAPGTYLLGVINISFTPDEPGTYDFELGGRDAGFVAVEKAITDITVIAASTSDSELIEGEETFVIGSVYQGGNVVGTETIELTATHNATGETTVVGTQELTVAPGTYLLGAINISFTSDEPGTYHLELGTRNAGTVEVEAAESDIQVMAASTSRIELIEGETTHTIGSIYQAGNIVGTETIELTATHQETGDTEVVGSQEVTVAPGTYLLGAINISFTPDEPGTYDLTLGDTNAGTVEVEAAESDIQVIAATTSDVELIEGETTHTIGSVYQAGNIVGTETIELTATHNATGDTEVVGSQELTVAPGTYLLGVINISFTPDAPGHYDLELGGRNAGTVEVESAESDIQVIAATTSDVELTLSETTHVIGSVYQAGNIVGTETIELTATHQETGDTEVVGSQEVTVAPGTYLLGVINISFTPDEPGTYHLELDTRNAGWVTVEAPFIEPTITAVHGQSTGYDPEFGDVVYTSQDATVDIEVESDLDIEEVVLLVDSLQATFVIGVDAHHIGGDDWGATVPVDDIPDDGPYELSVIAADAVDTGGSSVADEVLIIDREGPAMAATIENVDSEDATVVVESDEPLLGVPDVSVEMPDGSTESLSMTMETQTRYTGTLAFDESGEYEVIVVGTDRAGNEATDTASVVINTAFTLGDGEITIDATGTTIAFDLANDADMAMKTEELFLALSESTVNANLDDGELGVGFLTANLDSFIDYQFDQGNIEGATISMAIDEDALGTGVGLDDVGLYHYDASASAWNEVDSSVEQVGDEPFIVATVDGFSTYGALSIDEEPPALVDVTPANGATLDADVDEVTVRFEYDDQQSGVDVSSVELVVDGVAVTGDSDRTTITSSFAAHTIDVEHESTYDAAVTVADKAGNDATYTTSFTVADESATTPSQPSGPSQPSQPSGPSQPSQPSGPSQPSTSTPIGSPTPTVTSTPTVTVTLTPTDTATPSEPTTETPPTSVRPETPDESEDQLGFGWVVALVALLLSAALIRRRTE